jgi:hypothetical protein
MLPFADCFMKLQSTVRDIEDSVSQNHAIKIQTVGDLMQIR